FGNRSEWRFLEGVYRQPSPVATDSARSIGGRDRIMIRIPRREFCISSLRLPFTQCSVNSPAKPSGPTVGTCESQQTDAGPRSAWLPAPDRDWHRQVAKKMQFRSLFESSGHRPDISAVAC